MSVALAVSQTMAETSKIEWTDAMTDEMIEEAVARAICCLNGGCYRKGSTKMCLASTCEARHAIKAFKESLAKAGLGIRPRELTDAMDDAGTKMFEKLDGDNFIYQVIAESMWEAMWQAYPDKPDG